MVQQTPKAIVVERRVDAPPSRVFGYLTESHMWSRWQGVEATIDARPGGIFRMVMGNGMTARGQFVEIEDDRRVVFTWGWIDHPGVPPGFTTVEIELVEEGTGTLIRLSHTGLPGDEMLFHRKGWDRYLPRLAAAAVGDDPGPDPGLG